MFSFCKKTLQTFQTSSHSKSESSRPCRNVPSPTYGLSLIVAADCRKPANVLDSAAVKPPPPPPPPPPLTNSVKKDPSGLLGCLEDFSGVGPFDGLSSCTESLGFESCDQMEEMITMDEISRSSSTDGSSLKRRSRRKRIEDLKKLPPPLSSLNRNGQSNFFLKPLRKDGRLQLVEVRIDRPEIFQVSRQDGRLRLQLIGSGSVSESESEPELQEEEEEEERVELWKIPVTSGRCQELRNHYNHHNLPLWNHQCVT